VEPVAISIVPLAPPSLAPLFITIFPEASSTAVPVVSSMPAFEELNDTDPLLVAAILFPERFTLPCSEASKTIAPP
jgi:hypothetical protein